MKINLRMLLPVIVALFVLPMFAQSARATGINFTCSFGSAQPCGGVFNATFNGSGTATSASASGVTVINDSGPADDLGQQFTMTFDTTGASPNFTLTEIGGDGTTLTGTITAIVSGAQLGGGLD